MSQPKFSEGEEVILQSISQPQMNGDATVVKMIRAGQPYTDPLSGTIVRCRPNDTCPRGSASYLLEGLHQESSTGEMVHRVWAERCLKKKYKGSNKSFSDIMQELTPACV